MGKIKKFGLAVFVFWGFLFSFHNASAMVFNVNSSCGYVVYNNGMNCSVFNDNTIDTTGLVSVVIASNNFDDDGGVRITGPSGAVQTYDAPGSSFAKWPNGTNVTAWFNFDGVGIYTIHTFAKDTTCCDMGGWINFTVTVITPPTCNLTSSADSVDFGDPVTLSWTTTNATSASIDSGVGAVAPVSAGSVLVTPAATTTYTMTVVGPDGNATCQAEVSVKTVCGDGVISGDEKCDISGDIGCTDSDKPFCNGRCTFCVCSESKLVFLDKPIICTVQDLILFILYIIGGLALLMLVLGGILYIFAGPNPEAQNKAKKTFNYAIVGIILVLISYAIIKIITDLSA